MGGSLCSGGDVMNCSGDSCVYQWPCSGDSCVYQWPCSGWKCGCGRLKCAD